MRGKRSGKNQDYGCYGITPAYAGKTKSSSVRLFAHRDHPRGCGENNEAGAIEFNELGSPRRCGENSFQAWLAANGLGSPPQVRGKHLLSTSARGVWRITPAGAGKTIACPVENIDL